MRKLYRADHRPTSYCQKLVTVFLGGTFGCHFSVLEFVPLHDVGDLVRSIQAAAFLAGRLTQLEDHCKRRHAAEAAFGFGRPQTHSCEGALYGVGRSDVFPVLGRRIVEG